MSIVSNDIYQKIPDVARPTLTSTNQEVLTASGDKLKIIGRGNFLMRLDAHILCLLTDDKNDNPMIIRPHIVFTDGKHRQPNHNTTTYYVY